MKIIKDILAVAEKELLLEMRFKIPFIAGSFVEPFVKIAPFVLIYFGFFISGAKSIGDVTEENFIIFLILGMLSDVFFTHSYDSLYPKFMREKFWNTIEATLVAPLSKFSLLMGNAVSILVLLVPNLLIFFGIAYIFAPAPFQAILIAIIMLLCILSISIGIGLIHGTSALFNENYSPIFSYAKIGLVFISCFYYPITVFDQSPALALIKPIVLMNPIYHANNAIRAAWLFGEIRTFSILYAIGFALMTPIIAVFIFNKLWKKLNIQGY